MELKLDMYHTVAIAVGVFYLGQYLKTKINIFEKYCIPAPVIGGVIFALLALALRVTGVLFLTFDTTLQGVFMNIFFTSVGFTASFKLLKKRWHTGIYFPWCCYSSCNTSKYFRCYSRSFIRP